MHSTYLDRILDAHRAQAALRQNDLAKLRHEAAKVAEVLGEKRRDFAEAISDPTASAATLAVIAEIKRRSPSLGDIDLGLDPALVAQEYARGGAACLSVLTDVEFFGGSSADLVSARAACSLPVLRKDFTVCEADVYDALLMGADAVLLIVAALSDSELGGLSQLAAELGLAVLVEVHDERELERALQVGARIIGVNQRDLVSFEVDRDRALRLAGLIPPEVIGVAESGIRGPEDAAELASAGYQAILVGESLVRSADRAGAVRELAGIPVSKRAFAPSSSTPITTVRSKA